MTRWLRAAQAGVDRLTKPTELTEPAKHPALVPPGGVLSVKSVLSEGGRMQPAAGASALADLVDAWEERAAIRQYDGGQAREDAEKGAAVELGLDVETIRVDARRRF